MFNYKEIKIEFNLDIYNPLFSLKIFEGYSACKYCIGGCSDNRTTSGCIQKSRYIYFELSILYLRFIIYKFI